MYFIRPLVRQDTHLKLLLDYITGAEGHKRAFGEKNGSVVLISLNNVTCLQVDAGQMLKLHLSID